MYGATVWRTSMRPHGRIKSKEPPSRYKLYGDCGCLYLILPTSLYLLRDSVPSREAGRLLGPERCPRSRAGHVSAEQRSRGNRVTWERGRDHVVIGRSRAGHVSVEMRSRDHGGVTWE
eukprot:345759-Rhodomonas_salina.2